VNKFYTQLTLPAPIIDYKSIWPNDALDTEDSIPRWKAYPLNIAKQNFWTEEIRNTLISQGMNPTLVRIFRWRPNNTFPWHIDGTINEITKFAINWVLEGAGAIHWDSKLILPVPAEQYQHITYSRLPSKFDDEYEVSTLGHGCLVNTTIPHKVVNDNNIHRITISIQFENHINYEQAFEKLLAIGFVK
jgi:hypothetical protein